jgi:cardiolipin synthase
MASDQPRRRVWTAANALTVVRGLLAIPVAWAFLSGHLTTALVLVLIAGLTDFVDGYLARLLDASSDLGRLLDPLADKILLTVAFVGASIPGRGFDPLPYWLVALAIGRDLGILMGAVGIYLGTGYSGFHPTRLGKVNTVAEIVVILTFLLVRVLELPELWVDVTIWATAGLIVVSGVQYIFHARRQVREYAAHSDRT